MVKLLNCVLVIIGISGLLMACSDSADHINFIGGLLFFLACCFHGCFKIKDYKND